MAESQLSIRSTRATKMAKALAKREQRTITQIVERALDAYDKQSVAKPKESAPEFWDRIRRDYGTQHDLDSILDEHRRPHAGLDL